MPCAPILGTALPLLGEWLARDAGVITMILNTRTKAFGVLVPGVEKTLAGITRGVAGSRVAAA